MLKIIFVAYIVIASSLTLAKAKDDGSHIQPDNYYPRVKMVIASVSAFNENK